MHLLSSVHFLFFYSQEPALSNLEWETWAQWRKGYEATLGWCQEVEQLLTGQRISSLIPHPSGQFSNLLKILNPKFSADKLQAPYMAPPVKECDGVNVRSVLSTLRTQQIGKSYINRSSFTIHLCYVSDEKTCRCLCRLSPELACSHDTHTLMNMQYYTFHKRFLSFVCWRSVVWCEYKMWVINLFLNEAKMHVVISVSSHKPGQLQSFFMC